MKPEDRDNLEIMLKAPILPDELVAEYEITRKLVSRHPGGTQAMSAWEAAMLIRSVGLDPPKDEPKPTVWKEVEKDTPVFAAWGPQERKRPGTFQGVVDAGNLAVKFDGDDIVREVRSFDCELRDRDEPGRSVNWSQVKPKTEVIITVDGEEKEGYFKQQRVNHKLEIEVANDEAQYRVFEESQVALLSELTPA
jgi:hypothetical protein